MGNALWNYYPYQAILINKLRHCIIYVLVCCISFRLLKFNWKYNPFYRRFSVSFADMFNLRHCTLKLFKLGKIAVAVMVVSCETCGKFIIRASTLIKWLGKFYKSQFKLKNAKRNGLYGISRDWKNPFRISIDGILAKLIDIYQQTMQWLLQQIINIQKFCH